MADPSPKGDSPKAAAEKLYRFTWGYPCAYDFPGETRMINPGDELAWPDGPPDVNWEEVDPKAEKTKVAPPTGEEDKTKE